MYALPGVYLITCRVSDWQVAPPQWAAQSALVEHVRAAFCVSIPAIVEETLGMTVGVHVYVNSVSEGGDALLEVGDDLIH